MSFKKDRYQHALWNNTSKIKSECDFLEIAKDRFLRKELVICINTMSKSSRRRQGESGGFEKWKTLMYLIWIVLNSLKIDNFWGPRDKGWEC